MTTQDPRDAAASLAQLLVSLVAPIPGLPRDVMLHAMTLCGQAAPGTVLGELCRHWAAAALGGPEARAAFVAFLLRPLLPVDAS